MDEFKTIKIERTERVATVYLNRPQVHNAFNEVMLSELTTAFTKLPQDKRLRVIVLTGEGKSFCAGADLNWMQKMINYTYEENFADAMVLAECMWSIYSCGLPTIARVNGSAIGGGNGFVAACDIAIASDKAKFSLSEVKLGIIPACIAPYVIKRIGQGYAREFFLTGERISAERALQIGLVNAVVPEQELDKAVNDRVNQLISSGPNAIAMCKDLIRTVPSMLPEEFKKYTAEMIAKLRVSEEGQEGMRAFFEKRTPKWAKD